jgi:hypothetical protein
MPDWWRWLGAADVAGADRSSMLRGYGAPFLVFSLPTELVECEEPTKGDLLLIGGSGAGCVVARFKPQPLVTVGKRSKGRLTARLGQTGATRNVEHLSRVDGARGASHAAWR